MTTTQQITVESAGRLISAIIRKDHQQGYFLHQELRRCIIDSRKGGDWEPCQEPNGIPYDQTEFSNTKADGSMCKWQWGAMGGFVYCKTSIYTKEGGWTATVGRKPVLFSDVLLIELKKHAQ